MLISHGVKKNTRIKEDGPMFNLDSKLLLEDMIKEFLMLEERYK